MATGRASITVMPFTSSHVSVLFSREDIISIRFKYLITKHELVSYNKRIMAISSPLREIAEVSQRTSWYAFVRLFFLIVIAAPGLISLYLFHGWSEEVLRDIILFMIALATNALFYGLIIIHRNPVYQRTLAGIWIGLDVLLVTFLIAANGGIESRMVILYVMPILMAAAIFGRLATYIVALVSGLIYVGLIVGDYLGVIPVAGRLDVAQHTDFPYVINSVSFFVSVLVVIALAVDFITKLLINKEREAQESLNELQRAQEIARIGSWEWDLATDKISWTQGLTKILHTYHAVQPLAYQEYMLFVHPDDRTSHHKTVAAAVRRKKPFKSNYRIMMPDGSNKYVHTEGRLLTDRDGNITKIVGIAQDVTETYHLDDAKREFVSLASHQLRTPASGVKAYLSLLIDGLAGELTRKQELFAKKAYEANDRQLDIIDGLLSLASIESGKLVLHKEVANLNQIIKRCIPHHKLEAREKKQQLSVQLARTVLPVRVDASHLQMAIDNLISNAIKYTPERGKITIISRTTNTSAYLEVIDSGIGIAKSDLPLLFQKFSRVHDPAHKAIGGSGLGLYLAKYIIDRHRGTISVRSRPGQGAQFRIKLPLERKRS